MTTMHVQAAPCGCCAAALGYKPSRRSFIAAAGAGALALLAPRFALAAEGDYEAMVLGCIDPRLQEPVRAYTGERDLTGKFSHFVIAGAAIGAVAPSFQNWHGAFWDNLGTSVQLHRIKRVIAINHRDCGAARIAYGDAAVANRDVETETHRAALVEFRKQVAERQPKLAVETGLMALDGSIEFL